jgi:effector-binding domain-containing protein
MIDNPVTVKIVPEVLLVSYELRVPNNDLVPAYFDKAHTALWDFIHANNLKVIGPYMTLWHQGPEVMQDEVVEATFPIDREVEGAGPVTVFTLPETRVISYTHRGKFSDFLIAHKVLADWLEEHNLPAAQSYREVYLHHEPGDMDNSITEVQFPID